MSRMIMMAGVVCTVAGFAMVTGVRAADDQAYTLKVRRAVKVGEKTEQDVKSTGVIKKTPSGGTMTLEQMAKVSQPATSKLEGVFTQEVLAVTPTGQPEKVKLTFKRFEDTAGKQPKALLAPGTQLVMDLSGTGEPKVENIEGDIPLTADEKGNVRQLVNVQFNSEDDELLQTQNPRKVGEAWALDKGVLLRSLPFGERGVMPAELGGTAKLMKIEDVQGVKCAVVEIVIVAKDMKNPGNLMGGKIVGTAIGSKRTLNLPLDVNAPVMGMSRNSDVNVNVEFPDEAPLKRLDMVISEKRDQTVKIVK